MSGYPLAPLARVRRLREESAATDYAARERALAAARKETQIRQKALEDYVAWRGGEEDRRYVSILGQPMSLKAMDEFKDGLAALREKDNVLMEEIAQARKAEEEAAQARETAFAALRQARKAQEKIGAHREIWDALAARENERLADLEMEEFSSRRLPANA